MILLLSTVDNIEACGGLSLDLFAFLGEEAYGQLSQPKPGEFASKPRMKMPNAQEAFETLAALLRGEDFPKVEENITQAAVISAWGWTMCTGSVLANDLSELNSGIVVVQGVPMRDGERKRLIVDSRISNYNNTFSSLDPKKTRFSDYTAVASPGDHLALSTWTKSKKTRHFIAPSDDAFEVMKVYACYPLADPEVSWDVRLRFLAMQWQHWNTVHLLPCEHTARLDQVLTLPEDTWAFRGFDSPRGTLHRSDVASIPYVQCQEGSLHVGLVAGDVSARWALACNQWSGNDNKGESVHKEFARGNDCCFDCAISIARSKRHGRHVALIL